MVATAWVMLKLTGRRPASVGDPIATRGDNMAAVTWVSTCGGAREGVFAHENARPPRSQGRVEPRCQARTRGGKHLGGRYIYEQSTVKGYLAAIKFFDKMYAGWDLPTSHCMIVAAGKGIDRAHGLTQKKARVRLPATWALLAQGKQVVSSMVDGGKVMWLGLALSYFLLCLASEL